MLKPLKGVVQDLRSQIVKDVCVLFATIARTTRDAMAAYLREILPALVDVRGSGNKVCASYCSECIQAIVASSPIRGANLRFFVDTMLESKNKAIRLCCITSLKLVVSYWSAILDKNDVPQLEKALKNALYDASSTCRNQSHEFFHVYQHVFPKRAALFVTMLDYKVQRRLEAMAVPSSSAVSATPPSSMNSVRLF